MSAKHTTVNMTMTRVLNLIPLLPVVVYRVQIEKAYKGYMVAWVWRGTVYTRFLKCSTPA